MCQIDMDSVVSDQLGEVIVDKDTARASYVPLTYLFVSVLRQLVNVKQSDACYSQQIVKCGGNHLLTYLCLFCDN